MSNPKKSAEKQPKKEVVVKAPKAPLVKPIEKSEKQPKKEVVYVELIGAGGPLKKGVKYRYPEKAATLLISKGFATLE